MESPEIDFVYVASPNGLHFMHSRMALLHGKHVICEKPFTSNGREARELTALAAEKQLFLFEAIITLHMPNYIWIQENIKKLGRMRLFQGISANTPPGTTIIRPGKILTSLIRISPEAP